MLSYIDIEAFATTNYQIVAKPSEKPIEVLKLTLVSTHVPQQRKPIAKRILAAAKQAKMQQAS